MDGVENRDDAFPYLADLHQYWLAAQHWLQEQELPAFLYHVFEFSLH